jgi:HAD superfamily hydrolase (TIGR01509 family)
MGIKGVIFDFNGTLFWDTNIHNKAWDSFLDKKKICISDYDKNIKIHGKNNKDILNTLFPDQLSSNEIDKLSAEKEKIYQELCLETDMQLAPGAKEFLNYLIKVNIPFTIATASGLDNVDFYFKHLGLNSFFDRSKVVFNDGTIRSKPHPQIFQKAIDILGIDRLETLVFEDSISGIIAAENTGVARIIIVNSNDEDYGHWNYQKIKDFREVDTKLLNE